MSLVPDKFPRSSSSGRSRLWGALALIPLYLLCVLGAGLLWSRPWTLAALFAVVGVLLLWRWHGRSDLFFFVIAFILGPLGEWVAVSMGAWSYHFVDPAPPWLLPPWLPFAWGITMLFLKRTAELLVPADEAAETP